MVADAGIEIHKFNIKTHNPIS